MPIARTMVWAQGNGARTVERRLRRRLGLLCQPALALAPPTYLRGVDIGDPDSSPDGLTTLSPSMALQPCAASAALSAPTSARMHRSAGSS
jgi:hypothetical protein